MTALQLSLEESNDRRWTRRELKAAMRALVNTIATDRRLPPRASRMVRALQAHFGTNYDPCAMEGIGEVELAWCLVYPWQRQTARAHLWRASSGEKGPNTRRWRAAMDSTQARRPREPSEAGGSEKWPEAGRTKALCSAS
jgi:hypothetical protein